MLFNSYIFVLLFLPLCLVGWFSLNRLPSQKPALLFLLGMSLWFYGYFNPRYILIILCSIGGNYLLCRLMRKAAASENAQQKTTPPLAEQFCLCWGCLPMSACCFTIST